jgi:hypothetical protein
LLPFTGDDAMNSKLHPLFPLITSDKQEDGPKKKKPKKKKKTSERRWKPSPQMTKSQILGLEES